MPEQVGPPSCEGEPRISDGAARAVEDAKIREAVKSAETRIRALEAERDALKVKVERMVTHRKVAIELMEGALRRLGEP